MKIKDILKKTRPVSFEFFPPRAAEGIPAVLETLDGLKAYRPDFVSVTYGAGGSTRAFTEEITFNGGRDNLSSDELEALHRCLRLLHLVVGVSYYKAAVPPEMGFSRSLPSQATAALVKEIYHHGLGEFAYLNELDLTDRLEIPAADEAPSPPNKLQLNHKIVVPLGGGKDSLVTVELLRQQGIEFNTISIGKAPLIHQVAGAIGGRHVP